MKQLLAKWAELEPQRCRISSITSTSGDFEVFFDNYWYEALDRQKPCSGNTKFLPLTIGIIQMALQEAVEAQHWEFEQRWWGIKKEALIYPHQVSVRIKHQGDSFAEALLKAYLEGLEMLPIDAIALRGDVGERGTCSGELP